MNALPVPIPGRDSYQEFIRSRDLSVGVYRLGAGAVDAQRPHSEDEVYFVLKGRARFSGDERTIDVQPGLCIFVPAGEVHWFHDVVEPLELLVLFGPAEGTLRKESRLATNTASVARQFAKALDHEDYVMLADLLADECEYATPKGFVMGAPAIITSYQHSGAWVKSHIQHVRYESTVRMNEEDGSAIVTFIDHFEHNGIAHTHTCEQMVYVNAQGRVRRVVHIDLPGQREAADAFLKTIGVERDSTST